MGNKNVQTKNYISQNERFADLCNYYLFDGQKVIKAEELQEKDVTELALPYAERGTFAVEKIRDVLKRCAVKTADGITYLIIGIENQSDIHYAMVVRNMLYDALNYAAQVDLAARKHKKAKDLQGTEFLSGFAKEDKLLPVITITVYWNFGAWDAPRCLHEMLDVKQDGILEYVPDYKMNLIVPGEITDFNKFQTELGMVFEFVQCANDMKELKRLMRANRESGMYISREAADLLNACVNAGIKMPEQEGEEADMCKAIEGLVEEGRLEGREEGRLEGKQQHLVEMVCKKLRKNKQIAEIAEELEEEEAVIAEICKAAETCAPEYDARAVFEGWKKRKTE